MKLKHFYPLAGFVLPTLVIAYGFVIPHSCIAGWNAQSVGFATTLLVRARPTGRVCAAQLPAWMRDRRNEAS